MLVLRKAPDTWYSNEDFYCFTCGGNPNYFLGRHDDIFCILKGARNTTDYHVVLCSEECKEKWLMYKLVEYKGKVKNRCWICNQTGIYSVEREGDYCYGKKNTTSHSEVIMFCSELCFNTWVLQQ